MEEYEKLQIKYNNLYSQYLELKAENETLVNRIGNIEENKIVPLRKIINTLKQTLNNLLEEFEE